MAIRMLPTIRTAQRFTFFPRWHTPIRPLSSPHLLTGIQRVPIAAGNGERHLALSTTRHRTAQRYGLPDWLRITRTTNFRTWKAPVLT